MAERRSIPEIRAAVLKVVEAELRSEDIERIVAVLGGIAEALAFTIVFTAQAETDKVQDLLNTSARVTVSYARTLMEGVRPTIERTDN